ncbi:MAG: PTS mannitol transporter subunit IICBA, partial [bacterium]
YCIFGKGDSKESATGATIIHFFGGIQEIYFPYVLMNPILIVAPIIGSSVGIFILSMFECGLVAAPSPGSILAILALVPSGGHLGVLLAVGASALVSFIIASPIVKSASSKDGGASLEEAQNQMKANKAQAKGEAAPVASASVSAPTTKKITHIVFSCDAGMGSSAMGASRFRERIKALDTGIKVTNSSVDNIPADAQLVVTHQNLVERVTSKGIDIEVVSISNFLKDANLDTLYARLETTKGEPIASGGGASAPAGGGVGGQKDMKNVQHIVFSCDAGMGSSAMGASRFRERIKACNTGIKVTNSSVDTIPGDAQIVVTHQNLVERVTSKGIDVEVVPISNFLKDANLDALFARVEEIKK